MIWPLHHLIPRGSPSPQCPQPGNVLVPILVEAPSQQYPHPQSSHPCGVTNTVVEPSLAHSHPSFHSVPNPSVFPSPWCPHYLSSCVPWWQGRRSARLWPGSLGLLGRAEMSAEQRRHASPPEPTRPGGPSGISMAPGYGRGHCSPCPPMAAGSTQPHVLTSPRLQQPLSPCPPSLLPGSRALSGSQARASSGSPSSGSPSELSPPARPLSRWDCTMRCTAVGHRHQPPLRHREHWEALGSTGRGRGVRRAQVPQPTALHPPHMPSFPQFPHPDSSSLGAQPAPGAAPKSPLGRTWPLGTVPLSEGGV